MKKQQKKGQVDCYCTGEQEDKKFVVVFFFLSKNQKSYAEQGAVFY